MKIDLISGWKHALTSARVTISKKDLDKDPSKKWRLQMLYAEHSPIRMVRYFVQFESIKRWISNHLVRHKHGVEHFVGTQRTDRTGIARDKLPQDEESTHSMDINAQAFINISRKRLCKQSSTETSLAWLDVLRDLHDKDEELWEVCVRECVYRGFCPELTCCGYENTPDFKTMREEYINICRSLREEK